MDTPLPKLVVFSGAVPSTGLSFRFSIPEDRLPELSEFLKTQSGAVSVTPVRRGKGASIPLVVESTDLAEFRDYYLRAMYRGVETPVLPAVGYAFESQEEASRYLGVSKDTLRQKFRWSLEIYGKRKFAGITFARPE